MKNEIYRFSFNLTRQKTVSETTKGEDGSEVTTKKKVDQIVPFQCVLKEPKRKQVEEIDNVFSREVNKRMSEGYLTRAMALKLYQDNGGVFSDSVVKQVEKEAAKLPDLYLELKKLEEDKDTNEVKIADLNIQIEKIKKQFTDLQMIQNSIFAHSAETKALEKVIEWLMVTLTSVIEGEGDGIEKPLFKGDDYATKYDSMCELDDEKDDVYLEVGKKATSIFAYWYFKKDCTKTELDELSRKIDIGEY